jgi:transposase
MVNKKNPPKAKKVKKVKKTKKQLTTMQKEKLKVHSKHHSKKHIKMMENMMKGGTSFMKAHSVAKKVVGK